MTPRRDRNAMLPKFDEPESSISNGDDDDDDDDDERRRRRSISSSEAAFRGSIATTTPSHRHGSDTPHSATAIPNNRVELVDRAKERVRALREQRLMAVAAQDGMARSRRELSSASSSGGGSDIERHARPPAGPRRRESVAVSVTNAESGEREIHRLVSARSARRSELFEDSNDENKNRRKSTGHSSAPERDRQLSDSGNGSSSRRPSTVRRRSLARGADLSSAKSRSGLSKDDSGSPMKRAISPPSALSDEEEGSSKTEQAPIPRYSRKRGKHVIAEQKLPPTHDLARPPTPRIRTRKNRGDRSRSRTRTRTRSLDAMSHGHHSDADDENSDNEDPVLKQIIKVVDSSAVSHFVELTPATQTLKERLLKEVSILFYPENLALPSPSAAMINTDPNDYIRRGGPRLAESEGFHVPDPPKVSPYNLRKMERRLRWGEFDHGSAWFDESGRLIRLPDPLRREDEVARSLRRIMEDAERGDDERLELTLRKAEKATKFAPIPEADGSYLLIVRLENCQFTEHPLMNEERRLVRDLEGWLAVFRERKRRDVVGFLSQKLQTLKAAYDEQKSHFNQLLQPTLAPSAEPTTTSASSNDGIYLAHPANSLTRRSRPRSAAEEAKRNLRNLLEEIRNVRLLRDTESHFSLLLEFKILEAWTRLKSVRDSQGFSTTSFRLRVKVRENEVEAEEEARWRIGRDIEDEIEELRELHEGECEKIMKDWERKVEEWEARQREIETSEDARRASEPEHVDAESHRRSWRRELDDDNTDEEEDERIVFEEEIEDDGKDWRKEAIREGRRAERERQRSLNQRREREILSDPEPSTTKSTTRYQRPSVLTPWWSPARARSPQSRSPEREKPSSTKRSLPPLAKAPKPGTPRSASATRPILPFAPPPPSKRQSKTQIRASSMTPQQNSSPQMSQRAASLVRRGRTASNAPLVIDTRVVRNGSSPRRSASANPGLATRPPVDSAFVASPPTKVGRQRANLTIDTSMGGGRSASVGAVTRGSKSQTAETVSPSGRDSANKFSSPKAKTPKKEEEEVAPGALKGRTPARRPSRQGREQEASNRQSPSSSARTRIKSPNSRSQSKSGKKRDKKSRKSPNRKTPEKIVAVPAKERPPKPVIEEFDERAWREKIVERLKVSRRTPGSPLLSLSYIKSEPITDFIHCSKMEQNRRRAIDSTFVFMRFYYNDKAVTSTVPRPLDHDSFAVSFKGIEAISPNLEGQDGAIEVSNRVSVDETTVFGIRVREIPQSIRVALFETSVFGEKPVGEVFMAIPDASETANTVAKGSAVLSFAGPPFVELPPVGSDQPPIDKWISGSVRLQAVWGVNSEGTSLGPPVKNNQKKSLTAFDVTDPMRSCGPSGLLNLRRMMEWISNMKIDPNDPRESDLYRLKELVESADSADGGSFIEYWNRRKFFRVGIPKRLEMATAGVGFEEPDSKRLSVLKGRHDQSIHIACPVPFNDDDITDDMYELVADPSEDYDVATRYWGAKPQHDSSLDLSHHSSSTPTVSNRRFLKRIRTHQLILKARKARPLRVEDVVREERLPEAQPQQNLLMNFLAPVRPLKPIRISAVGRTTSQPTNGCFISVQVLRGYNVPVRRRDVVFDDVAEKISKSPISVRSYLEMSFQKSHVRTTVYEGPNPQWNETITLEVVAPDNDFRPESLLDGDIGTEKIYFNLFDEILVDMIEDDRDRRTQIHQRRERNWLGSFSIPFTAIYEQSRIEGSFHVKSPPILMSYERNPTAGPIENSVLVGVDPNSETTISMFITLDPPLTQPQPLKLKLYSDEPQELLRSAAAFTNSFPINGPQPSPLAADLDGRRHIITRFIRAQRPPHDMPNRRHLARYVSHIPFINYRTALVAAVSPWCTSDQLLNLGAGDAIEHAILLCNFLLYRGETAAVVLGRGIPEGDTAYVAIWERPPGDVEQKDNPFKLAGTGDNVRLINAVLGDEYGVKEQHLPLQEVHCIFNEQNVWGNIQQNVDPARLNWNLMQGTCWRPFLNAKVTLPNTRSMQVESLVYQSLDNRYCRELEIKIERAVIARLEEWRGNRVTRWNRMCSKVFKPFVARLETDYLNNATTQFPSTAVLPLRSTYRICGFPLHCTYTDTESVVQMVNATDVHSNADPTVEFALAVWCGAYPGGFVSVWLYICSLTRSK